MKNRSFLFLVIIALTFKCIASENIQSSEPLNLSSIWFKPFLTESNDPVCSSVLVDAQKKFLTSPTDPRERSSEQMNLAPIDSNWTRIPGSSVTPIIINNMPVYVREFIARGCGGACEGNYFAASTTPFPELGGYADSLKLSENQITESVPEYLHSLGLFQHSNGMVYSIVENKSTTVYKLKQNATWEKVCHISAEPPQDKNKSVQTIFGSIHKLNDRVNEILGEEGSYCGSMQTLSRWRFLIADNLKLAISRPWSLIASKFDDAPYEIDIKNLATWSLGDATNQKNLNEFKVQLSQTTDELANFYQSQNHWTKQQSTDLAYKSLTLAISSGIRFYQYKPYNEKETSLLTAITTNRPLSEIEALSNGAERVYKIAINIAIHRPEVIQFFIEKGVNPNLQNEFNKSLLMYAAQNNEINSAKTLLKAGTDPNLVTIIISNRCDYRLSKSGMTALHYAVRYASTDFVKLLIANGADPFAKTSETDGSYPIDWLHKYTAETSKEKNSNIKSGDIAELERLLELPPKEEIAQRVQNGNLIAEKAFALGDVKKAYTETKKILNLDPKNDRALANLSLIALKTNKQEEALEAAQNLLNFSTDNNQKANAWYNIALICKTIPSRFSYNGISYCDQPVFYYFLESYKLNPNKNREDSLTKSLTAKSSENCYFPDSKTYIFNPSNNYRYRYTKNIYAFKPKYFDLQPNKITWKTQKQVTQPDNTKKYVDIYPSPNKLLSSISVGDYELLTFQSEEAANPPFLLDGIFCASQ